MVSFPVKSGQATPRRALARRASRLGRFASLPPRTRRRTEPGGPPYT